MAKSISFDIIARDRASKTFTKIGQRAGKVLAGGIAAAGVAAVKFGQQASDLAETQSKVNQIFGGKAAQALQTWSKGAATAMGQSQQTALDAAATFGVFGKSAGKTGADLAKFSMQNTELASDLASFHNTSPEEAIEALGAAFRGEAEPIRKFGVLLDDATLRAQAMKMGLIKTTKEALTPQQKVLAAQAAILKQTKDAQGDFARTSDGMANKQRILKAELANFTTELGTKALPAMLKAVEVGLKMVDWIDRNQKLAGILVAALAGLTAAVWAVSVATKVVTAVTKTYAAMQWLLNAAMAANPIVLIVIAIVALIAIIILVATKTNFFQTVWKKAWGGIKKAFWAVFGFIKNHWKTILAILTGPVGIAVLVIARSWDRIKAGMQKAFDFIKRVASAGWSSVKDGARSVVDFVRSIPDKLRNLADRFGNAGKALIGAFVNGMKNAAGIISGISGNVWNAVRSLLNGAISKINSALEFNISVLGKGISINPPDIPHLARGGIVRARSGGTLALLGEGGSDEMVVPLSGPNAPRGGRGGAVVNINFNGLVGDPKAAAREVRKVLLELKRTSGVDLGLT